MEGYQSYSAQSWFNVITQITLDYQKKSKIVSEAGITGRIAINSIELLNSEPLGSNLGQNIKKGNQLF